MKLIRVGSLGFEKQGIETDDGRRLDASNFGEDFDEAFFGSGGIERFKRWLVDNEASLPEFAKSERYGCPIGRPSKIVCVGLNYRAHAIESGMDVPEEPVLFFKATTAICGPNDSVKIPEGSSKTDWEVELGVVIGKEVRSVSVESALEYVAGYVLHNDYSEREFQLERGGQWVKGKSCDTFAPLGPYLVTPDEVGDPQSLRLWLKVNGETYQDSNTSDMIFTVAEQISHISHYMTLLPGDVISTGTPFGVGLGFNPPRYLNKGDVVTLGIDQLGTSTQKAV